jgi:hypothetical protein
MSSGTTLCQKLKNGLNESRILVLCTQVLIGFQFRSVFEKGYEKLTAISQDLLLGSLIGLLVSLALLISPAAYHRIVEEGEDSHAVYQFTSRMMTCALLPLSLAMGINFFAVTYGWIGTSPALALSAAVVIVALGFWYGLELVKKKQIGKEDEKLMKRPHQNSHETPLSQRIEQVLTEARLVLPGAQALLGFGFVTMLMESFEKLPQSSKNIHIAGLVCVTLAVILLMTPAAYHRIVERGEDTERFHRFATGAVLAALIPLALGICGELFVVVRKVTESQMTALAMSAGMLLLFYGLWFALMFAIRARTRG